VKDEMLSGPICYLENVSDFNSDFVDVELKDAIMMVNSAIVVEI
jgi:hypothetical protein